MAITTEKCPALDEILPSDGRHLNFLPLFHAYHRSRHQALPELIHFRVFRLIGSAGNSAFCPPIGLGAGEASEEGNEHKQVPYSATVPLLSLERAGSREVNINVPGQIVIGIS